MFSINQLNGFNVSAKTSLTASGLWVIADTDRMSRTPGSAGNRKTMTFSLWVKRVSTGALQTIISASETTQCRFVFTAADKIAFNRATTDYFLSTPTYTSTTQWYHICLGIDTSQAAHGDQFKLEVDGVNVASDNTTAITQNQNLELTNAEAHLIGKYFSGGTDLLAARVADFQMVDGSKLTASNFRDGGSPATYTGAFGTTGFRLDFAASGDLGNDVSGNNNDWTNTGVAQDTADFPT